MAHLAKGGRRLSALKRRTAELSNISLRTSWRSVERGNIMAHGAGMSSGRCPQNSLPPGVPFWPVALAMTLPGATTMVRGNRAQPYHRDNATASTLGELISNGDIRHGGNDFAERKKTTCSAQ